MSNGADGQERRNAPTLGILYLHGAGMPEAENTIAGDPLATIANGLIDTFTHDEFLRTGYRMVTKASEQEKDLTGLDLEIFCRPEGTKPEEKLCTLRMRDVLWKPTMRKSGLLEYIPLLWLWAMAFQSHVTRMAKLEEFDRKSSAEWDEHGLAVLEELSAEARRRSDFWSRTALAVGGILFCLLFAFLAGEIAKWLNPTWTGESPGFQQVWQVTTSVISVSIVSGVLLFLLAVKEYVDRKRNEPHGRLHMFAIILTTTWLAIFLIPVLLLVYYSVGLFTVVGTAAGAAGAILIALWIDAWWVRVVFLFLIALGIWLVTLISAKLKSGRFQQWLRKDMRHAVAGWLTTLLVISGAPLVIALILVLELLSVLPFVGDSLKSLATRISEASSWENLKDIQIFLTDSSRAAVARCCIEKAIAKLADEVDGIYVLSHSLGTVVAYETLVQVGHGDGVTIKKGDAVYDKLKGLVTFGSPLNKIRILANKTAEDNSVLTDFDYTRFDDRVVLQGPAGFRWLNFYSSQDVVSDVLTLYARQSDPIHPDEFGTASADDILTAHGAYWTDRGFWNTILQAMGVIYPGGDLTRIAKLSAPNGERPLLDTLRNEGILTRGQFDSRIDRKDQSAMLAKLAGTAP